MSDAFLMRERFVRDEEGRELDFAFFEVEAASDALQDLQWSRPESLAAQVSEPIQMRIEDDGVFPDYQGGSIPLCSARVKDAIERVGRKGVTFFPVVVTNAGPDTPTYFAIHCGSLVSSDVGDDGRVLIDERGLDGVSVFRRSLAGGLNVTAALKTALDDVPTLGFQNLRDLGTSEGD